MWPKKAENLQKLPFSEEQIRIKAYEISQKNPECSHEENYFAAIETLKDERRFWLFKIFWRWTGFGEKKLWDFIQLLIVPIVIAATGATLQHFTKQSEQQDAKNKANQEILKKYQDEMLDLLEKGLLSKKPNPTILISAQIKTITALKALDSKGQHDVIQFISGARLNDLAEKKGLLYKSQITKAILKESDLSGINLTEANLSGTNLTEANITEANLSGINLTEANLSGANLTEANLKDSNLKDSKCYRAILDKTSLNNANLTNANLFGAGLIGADLSQANLSSANLAEANLSGANLSGANLSGANLSGANLSRTRELSPPQIQQAKNWKEAKYAPEFRKKLGLDSQP
jgi:uncharacterized protein YjbI with pentapeptide repeats